ncbi:hypothetical protein [Silvibacterium acidisoli]|uniref:hypothetical protein n=1 Tax=Acidobacteriaceae bacterium ZG23-2 TaxID=2883246 RepID=UPI00406C4E7C
MSGRDPELDKWDQWIDPALEEYAASRDEDSPRRITAGTMRRIGDWRSRRRRIRFLEFAGGLAFACALAAVLLLHTRSVSPVPVTTVASETRSAPPEFHYAPHETPATPVRRRQASLVRKQGGEPRQAAPRLDQFPVPSALSSEERTMIAFTSRSHVTAQEVRQLQFGAPRPLKTPPIETPEIQTAALRISPVVPQ